MTKILFTSNGLDGIGCAVLGRAMGIEKIYYCGRGQGNCNFVNIINETLSVYDEVDEVIITALPISTTEYAKIKDVLTKVKSVTLIDNHEQALEVDSNLEKAVDYFDKGIVSTYNSSSMLMFMEYSDGSSANLAPYAFIIKLIDGYVMRNFDIGEKLIADLQRVYMSVCYQRNDNTEEKPFQEIWDELTTLILSNPPKAFDNYPDWYKKALDGYMKRDTLV